MKKLISLMIALTLIVTCLSGVVFAADPIAKVTTGDKTVEVDTVDALVAAVSSRGTSVVTLLKDVTHSDQIKIPACTFDLNGHTWSTKDAAKNALYFDGKTLTDEDATNLYTVVKNGTIDAGRTAISCNVGALRVENVTMICHAEIPAVQLLHTGNNSMAYGLHNDGNVMENCTVYCADGPVLRFNSSTDYSKMTYTVKNCTFVTESEATPLLMCHSSTTVGGTYVIGENVNFYYKEANKIIQTEGVAPVVTGETIRDEDGTHSVTVAGTAYAGLKKSTTAAPAPVVPETPAAPATPSTPAVDVPKTGVSVVALGVMAMVSLAGAVVTKKH